VDAPHSNVTERILANAMAFQSVPETAEIAVRYVINGILCINTFYARRSGGYSLGQLTALASTVDAWVHADWKGFISNQAAYNNTIVRGLENENDFEVIDDTNSGVGASASAPMPNNVCLAIKRLSGLTGRSARGRVYCTLLAADVSTDENRVGSTSASNRVTALNALTADIAGIGWTEVIVSRFSGGVKRAAGVTFPVVAYQSTDLRIDTQRRRLPSS